MDGENRTKKLVSSRVFRGSEVVGFHGPRDCIFWAAPFSTRHTGSWQWPTRHRIHPPAATAVGELGAPRITLQRQCCLLLRHSDVYYTEHVKRMAFCSWVFPRSQTPLTVQGQIKPFRGVGFLSLDSFFYWNNL